MPKIMIFGFFSRYIAKDFTLLVYHQKDLGRHKLYHMQLLNIPDIYK